MPYNVRVGVEWINAYRSNDGPCSALALRYCDSNAEGFRIAMRGHGHDDIFNWGNDNAWSSDFDHPDFGGNALSWSDNVHFCYFAGHGGQFHFDEKLAFNIGFSSRHNPPDLAPCRSMSPQWRLGTGRLKWFAVDSCQAVTMPDAMQIVEVWGDRMQGLHLLLSFIDLQRHGPRTQERRIAFADDICGGWPIGAAWLSHGYGTDHPEVPPNLPLVIAAGATRDEALQRRDHETLDWLYYDVRATNWLAWKWRG